LKASNLGAGDAFGRATAISADGKTLVVGAWLEDSLGNDPLNNSALESGAVYVYRRSGLDWVQVAFLKSSNSQTGDHFGVSVALSANGKVLAVGADGEDSDNQQIPSSNRAPNSGAVYVFTLEGTAWKQAAYLKASAPLAEQQLGHAVTLSGDGLSLWASAQKPVSNSFVEFLFSNALWAPSDPAARVSTVTADSVAVSTSAGANEQVLLSCSASVGSMLWAQGGTTALPAASSCALSADGQVFALAGPAPGFSVYSLRSGTLTQVYTADAGTLVALSADGQTLAASTPDEDVRLYQDGATGWDLQRVQKPMEMQAGDHFGGSLSLSGNGLTLIVGAPNDSRSNGEQISPTDFNAPASGAVYVF
jgi:WD40 repeat protein